jgi:hypothetical protein
MTITEGKAILGKILENPPKLALMMSFLKMKKRK